MNKKALAVAVGAALAAPMAAQAVSTNWYGHVNRAMQFQDDGEKSDVTFVDVTAYSTRMGWTGTADAGRGVTAGAKIEYDLRSNTVYGSGGQTNGADASDTALRIRKAEVWFSGNWGTLTLGQGSDATDGIAYATHNSAFEGTELAHDWGMTSFRDGTGAVLGVNGYSFSSSFDGGRRDRVRYDSPSFGPVKIAVSAGTNDRYDGGVYISSDLGGGSLLARIGYSRGAGSVTATRTSEAETYSGSASYQFSQGTFIDGFYGTRDIDGGSDPDTWYIALGHNWGNNSAAIDYMEGSDVTAGCEGDRIGLGFSHNIPAPQVTLYTGYHHYSADCNAAGQASLGATNGLQDIDEFHVGARIHFD